MARFFVLLAQLAMVAVAVAAIHVPEATISTTLFYLKASLGAPAGKYVHVRLDAKSNAQNSFPTFTSSTKSAARFFVTSQGYLVPYSQNTSLASYTAVEYFQNDAQTGYQIIYFQPNYPQSATAPAILCQNVNGTIGQIKNISCNFADAQPIDGPAGWGYDSHTVLSLFQQGNTGSVQDLGFHAVIAGSFSSS